MPTVHVLVIYFSNYLSAAIVSFSTVHNSIQCLRQIV
jgi:hypothetical protein